MQMPGKPDWDYSPLAANYNSRAPYHPELGQLVMSAANIVKGDRIADVGAGTGRVAQSFAERGCQVDAIEPCAEMAAIGQQSTSGLPIEWHATRAECSGLANATYAATTFGSSFNVVKTTPAVVEAARILRPDGCLIALYNHRDLDDPLQCAIEGRIRRILPQFNHGVRRQDPTAALEMAGHFRLRSTLELAFRHRTSLVAFINGFRAHATLIRQAGNRMPEIIDSIEEVTHSLCLADGSVEIPFCTRVWIAERRQ